MLIIGCGEPLPIRGHTEVYSDGPEEGRLRLPVCETLSFLDISQYSLQQLIDVGSDVNTLDNENATVIHLVAEEGCIKCARILLPLCTDIDAKMKNGDTPLIRAVKRGKEMSSRSKPKMNE